MVLIDRIISSFFAFFEKRRLKNVEFCIVSNNCWGAEVYKICNREYNTPFVGLFLYPNCYLTMCNDVAGYLTKNLYVNYKSKYFNGLSKYPIGHLDDIELHFLHYNNLQECESKWSRRSVRTLKYLNDGGELTFKFCSRDGASDIDFDKFDRIKGNKISFSNFRYEKPYNYRCNKSDLDCNGNVRDGVELFRSRYRYFSLVSLFK